MCWGQDAQEKPEGWKAGTEARLNLLLEVKAKTYFGMKTMTRKFRKYGQIERIVVHLKNATIFCAKYKNEESTDRTKKRRRCGKGN